MKVSDVIVEFLLEKKIEHIFGYPGGMITHFLDSVDKYSKLSAHILYHEQGAAFAANGYAQASLKPSLAYATSGPGATNLITGICNAYYDSIPTIFLTGQVNTGESKKGLRIKQRGFQETDIISMVKKVTKFSAYVSDSNEILYYLQKAYHLAVSGRPGPVLLDIPMDIQRSNVNKSELRQFVPNTAQKTSFKLDSLMSELKKSKRPCILLGAGVKSSGSDEEIKRIIHKLGVPVVTSMPAIDILPSDDRHHFGFIGAYGHRSANFIVAKCDLLLVLGSRLDIRQTGVNRTSFAPNAKIIRVDIDKSELSYRIRETELQYHSDLKPFLESFIHCLENEKFEFCAIDEWNKVCDTIKNKLAEVDKSNTNDIICGISKRITNDSVLTTDVGQNQVWIAQAFQFGAAQQLLMSAGHGAMGYSLPAAIGAHYATGKKAFCFCGDGGIQMNIQELQVLSQNQLPIKVIILNNRSLGMIRHFQEMYFQSNYVQTVKQKGYEAPDFQKIAYSYNLNYKSIQNLEEINQIDFNDGKAEIIEVFLDSETYVYPKLEFGKPNQDQEPLIERDLYQFLMDL